MNLAIALIVAGIFGLLLMILSGIISIFNRMTNGKINEFLTNLFKED